MIYPFHSGEEFAGGQVVEVQHVLVVRVLAPVFASTAAVAAAAAAAVLDAAVGELPEVVQFDLEPQLGREDLVLAEAAPLYLKQTCLKQFR